MGRTKKKEAPRRLALVVLGMHRSGTSALAGCLARLGAVRPRTEIAPTVNNPKGYYESEPVMAFNDRLLALMGSAWHDWRGPEIGMISADVRRDLAGEAGALLADEFGAAKTIVLKDPRLCRLMPLWRDFLDSAGYEARYVLPVRRPLQSALSLRARNGFSLESGRLLWLGHVFEAERRTRGLRRHILASESLMKAPQAVLSAIAGALAFPADLAALGDFIDPALFHDEAPDGLPSENRWIAGLSDRVYGVLQAGDGPETRLDALYSEFERAAPPLERPRAGLSPAFASPAKDSGALAGGRVSENALASSAIQALRKRS
jgi:hypothetical protein